jgi:hypothetical protein
MDSQQINILESTQFLDSNVSKVDLSKTPANPSLNHSIVRPRSPTTKYNYIQTLNIKFSTFLDKLLISSLPIAKLRQELTDYVTGMETKFGKKIEEMRWKIEKERKKRIFEDGKMANEVAQKNELEGIFVEAVEEVRKNIMKRRLKQVGSRF